MAFPEKNPKYDLASFTLEKDLPLNPGSVDEVVHPVEQPQQRRLAASRGTDQGRHPVFLEVHGDVGERPEFPVVEIDILCFYYMIVFHRYHLFLLRMVLRMMMATRSTIRTSPTRTRTVPNWMGRVASMWVPAVART